MASYRVKLCYNEENKPCFDCFGNMVPIIAEPTMKVKDWFYAKNIRSSVPSIVWTHIIAVVEETEKAMHVVTTACDQDGGLAGDLFWVPKKCVEEIEKIEVDVE